MSDFGNADADAVPESVLDKIKKLMAMAEGGKDSDAAHRQNEAAVALSLAQKLLQEWNLDISAINNHRTAGDLGSVLDQAFAFESKSKSKYGPNRTRTDQVWVTTIAQAVARGSFCKVIVNKYDIMFIGRARNVEASMYMFANVTAQVGALALEAVRKFNADKRAERAERGVDAPIYVGNKGDDNYTVYRNSYLLGAASIIKSRLDAQRTEFEQTKRESRPAADGAAPVVHTGMEVVMTAESDVEDYMYEKFGIMGKKQRDAQAAKWKKWDAEYAVAVREYKDERTPAEKERDAKREAKRQEHADQKERNYYRRYGHHSGERQAKGGPQMNYNAYDQGTRDGRKVSLDAGKVEKGERKQLGK